MVELITNSSQYTLLNNKSEKTQNIGTKKKKNLLSEFYPNS